LRCDPQRGNPSLELSQAVPSELKQQQKFKDLLMTNTEKVLLSVHPVRPKGGEERQREIEHERSSKRQRVGGGRQTDSQSAILIYISRT
jgi:hypothetical protein